MFSSLSKSQTKTRTKSASVERNQIGNCFLIQHSEKWPHTVPYHNPWWPVVTQKMKNEKNNKERARGKTIKNLRFFFVFSLSLFIVFFLFWSLFVITVTTDYHTRGHTLSTQKSACMPTTCKERSRFRIPNQTKQRQKENKIRNPIKQNKNIHKHIA